MAESAKNLWTARELERQINSQLYERLLLSNDKKAVLAAAKKERHPEKAEAQYRNNVHVVMVSEVENRSSGV